MDDTRINEVSESIASLGYEGIVEFDKSEPEYGFITSVLDQTESDTYLALLSTLAATQDYQLSGDAQLYWQTLGETVESKSELNSVQQVNETLSEFLGEPVNQRFTDQKRSRLIRIQENDFGEWFVENHSDVDPVKVWEKLAAALETDMSKKTVVVAVKIYDIFNLIKEGEYLDLPTDVPIPCDLQVERVATSSGIVEDEDGPVMNAWARVMEEVNDELDRPVSMLRIDSIVWQSGQIISENDDRYKPSRHALTEYFTDIGLDSDRSERLAQEFTVGLD